MARSKQWTEEDARFAREWLGRTDIKVESIQDAEPDVLAQHLKDRLTVSDWTRMLGAIRQRKHQAASDTVRITKSELDRLRSEAQSKRQHNGIDKDAEIKRLRDETTEQAGVIERLRRERDILTGRVNKLDGAEATLDRLRADLAARDAEIQRLKAEVALAHGQVAAVRAHESGYREQISRLESRPGQIERSANRQSDENVENLSDRDCRILELHQAGQTKRGIARELGISDGTVRNVLGRLRND
ncbi:regulatory protein LuxR [Thiorhodococcus drewsii AZ1]|uniref:Regulatory protein LuxR n=1 Tax=Thiorhodococcus drewsii AZ1 TaxID=765913 RepID=G2E731_9GAMM|nr:LuxR C-terminal-related transcriptional regulator [Thiorhodococcus drewsii]EGV28062.1 regulatory protein LuxR [Thiorhodococcus drewsii AZ1]